MNKKASVENLFCLLSQAGLQALDLKVLVYSMGVCNTAANSLHTVNANSFTSENKSNPPPNFILPS